MLDTLDLDQVANEISGELHRAKRPLIIYGWGVKLAGAIDEARALSTHLDIPIAVSWAARDAFPEAIGAFGTHGVRHANFAVQKADYILCVGCRLDTKATGSPASSFAPNAKLVMVDVDEAELEKMEKIGRRPYRKIRADAREFLRMAAMRAGTLASYQDDYGGGGDTDSGYVTPWKRQIQGWAERYPVILPGYRKDPLNPYVIVEKLGDYIKPDDVIVSDTGLSLAWMMQAYPFKGERFIHAFNNTPMGYGLPAAIGAAFSTGKKVVCITGDGGLGVNVTELATVVKHKLPITIILFNNKAHGMCQQTERQWFNGEYCGTGDKDIATPDFQDVARAYGLMSYGQNSISCDGLDETLKRVFRFSSPAFLEIQIDRKYGLAPQAKFGHRLEDQEPLLPREELAKVMA